MNGFNSRTERGGIRKTEDKTIEIIQSEQNKENILEKKY